jgi:hypothetical protein
MNVPADNENGPERVIAATARRVRSSAGRDDSFSRDGDLMGFESDRGTAGADLYRLLHRAPHEFGSRRRESVRICGTMVGPDALEEFLS